MWTVALTDLDDLKSLRDQLCETIRLSAAVFDAGKPERYLSDRDKAERRKVLAGFDAAILKLEGL